MAFNLIYYGQFNDILEDQIDINIYQKDFLGTPEELLLDSNPLVISCPKKEFDDQLFGTGCKINIVNDSSNFFRYDSLFSFPERSNYIEIIKTSPHLDASILLFQGYIMPEMYTSTLEKNIRVTITATDQLNILDNYVPLILVDTSDYRSDEFVNAMDLTYSILYDTDITDHVAVNNYLYNINYVKDSSSTVLDNVFLNTDNFHDDNGIEDSKTVLSKILKSFYSRVYYNNGKWMIERIPDFTRYDKQFIEYTNDSSTLSNFTFGNTRRDLTCPTHKIVAKTATLSFNPGYQKVVCTLNYKKAPSLTENYYYDLLYKDSSAAICTSTGYPLPQYRRWQCSGTDASIQAYPFSSVDVDSGLFFYSDIWGSFDGRTEWTKDQFMSTKFMFTPSSKTELKVNFDHAFTPAMVFGNDPATVGINARFGIRAFNPLDGSSWWIAKSNEDDSSTYWSSIPYQFNVSVGWADIEENDYMLEVNEKINITEPLVIDVSLVKARVQERVQGGIIFFWPWYYKQWVTKTYAVPSVKEYVGELYLDIYTMLRTYDPALGFDPGYHPYYTWFGDVDVDVDTEIPYNKIEAPTGQDFNTIKETTLDIFDVSTIAFTNGLYNIGDDQDIRSIWKWRDNDLREYSTLQQKYVLDLVQMYWKPRYLLDLDIISGDSSMFTMSEIYTHNVIKKDGSMLEFILNGYDYNVKQNTYRLNLLEFVADDGFEIGAPDPYFILDDSTFSFNYLGYTTDDTVGISTNVRYGISTDENWILWTLNSSSLVTIDCSENYGDARDGSLWFTPNDPSLDPQAVSIHQDASTDIVIEFTNDGSILLSNIMGFVIDLSLYAQVNAYAYSEFGYYFSATSDIDFVRNGGYDNIAYAEAYAESPGDSSSVTEEGYFDVIGLSNGSTAEMYEAMTDYYAGMDGETYAIGYAKILSATVEGGGPDVSIRYNKWSVDQYGNKTKSYE